LVEARLLRLSGHGEHDDASYVDPRLRETPVGRDCLAVARAQLLEMTPGIGARLDSWRETAQQTVEDVVAQAQREAGPDPYKEDWCALFSKHVAEPCGG
jgi:pyruvate dehydrogenase E1 component alpha subunit/2-oxoisovalerate dehydrogenase E1 component alpha subunit